MSACTVTGPLQFLRGAGQLPGAASLLQSAVEDGILDDEALHRGGEYTEAPDAGKPHVRVCTAGAG
jgi:hypothetical protein